MADISGKIWSAVRRGLDRRRERLIEAFDSKSYERESSQLDQIAREVTEEIESAIEQNQGRARHQTDGAEMESLGGNDQPEGRRAKARPEGVRKGRMK